MKKIILLFSFPLFFSSCEKVEYYPDNQIPYAPTIDMAHRAGGNLSFRDNTLEAVMNALPLVGGIEVDVMLSKSRTVWLSHSPKVIDCAGEQKCFSETFDSEIRDITNCNGADISYTTLEQVMQYMDQNNIRKSISIDLKGWAPCGGEGIDVEGIMRLEAEEIIRLGHKYHLNEYLLFETEIASVLKWIKEKDSSVQTYYTTFGDFERGMLQALDHGFTGISYKSFFADELNAGLISMLHKKGLRINAWNIPDNLHAQQLRDINCDFIQIDL